MKHLKWLLLPVVILLTSGCWNYRELSELSIVGAIGIDAADNGYNVSVEIINAKKVANISGAGSSAGNEASYVVYSAKGKTIKEALGNIVFEAPYPLYIGHLNLLVIGDEAARKGIKEFIDYLMADTESRKIFPTVVVENGKASDAMKILMPLETVTSSNIKESLVSTGIMNGTVSNRLFDEITMCLYMSGRNPTISSVKIVGDQDKGEKTNNLSSSNPSASVVIDGSAVLKGDKLVGYFDDKESLGYTIMRDMVKTMNLAFPCDNNGNYGTVVIDKVKNSFQVNLVKNKPVGEISITGKAALPEFNCKFDISKSKNITEVEKMADKELKKIINNSIKKAQKEFNSDVFGFGEQLYKNHNSYWEKHKNDWDKIFPTLDYKIKTDIKIESIDATIKSAKGV